MAFPLRRGSKTTKVGKASSWRERKKKQITQFMTLESHFNHVWVIGIQLKGYHVFLCPTFGILVLISYLKC